MKFLHRIYPNENCVIAESLIVEEDLLAEAKRHMADFDTEGDAHESCPGVLNPCLPDKDICIRLGIITAAVVTPIVKTAVGASATCSLEFDHSAEAIRDLCIDHEVYILGV